MTCMFCGKQATHEIRKAPCCERCWQKLQHVLEDEDDHYTGYLRYLYTAIPQQNAGRKDSTRTTGKVAKEVICRVELGGGICVREFYSPIQELVRCKDCKYWQDNNGGYPHSDCKWNQNETPDPDDFCSAGERRNDDD